MTFEVIARVRFNVEVDENPDEDAEADAVYEAALERLPVGIELDDIDYAVTP